MADAQAVLLIVDLIAAGASSGVRSRIERAQQAVLGARPRAPSPRDMIWIAGGESLMGSVPA
jgi:hypothetical protein